MYIKQGSMKATPSPAPFVRIRVVLRNF